MVEQMVVLPRHSTHGGPAMIMSQEKHFIKARKEFEALLSWIGQADEEGLRIDQVERGLFSRLLAIGFVLLEAFVAKFGRGDLDEMIEQEGRTLRRSAKPHRRRYLSIFGELKIGRFVYAIRPKQKIEYAAVDEQLGLPQGECSYALEDWVTVHTLVATTIHRNGRNIDSRITPRIPCTRV